ncbi:MAG: hypothetical protein IPG43_01580 [Proteobacteria bacterium]|nr:hypothetical protein [Pseudomonadota bacterium]
MTKPTDNVRRDTALIAGGGPGISSSCARLFAAEEMKVAVAARNPDKPVLETLEKVHGVRRYACDAGATGAAWGANEMLTLDVTDQAAVSDAVTYVIRAAGCIDHFLENHA